MRDRIFEIVETDKSDDRISVIYDSVMMVLIIVSLIPLAFKESNMVFDVINAVTVTAFMVDYILRLITADLKLKKGVLSFFIYPFTFMALIDLAAILPAFLTALSGLRLIKLFRLFRTFRVLRTFHVFRSFKMFRYAKSVQIISNVIQQQKTPLLAVGSLAVGYVLISALIIFNVEPETFHNFFEAIYWATVSLTTVGYGDIYPITTIGRIVAMVSSFVGIAIVALPAGIITAGYMEQVQNNERNKDKK
ncbi:MAG: ion transporter [Acutalibacter sp.]|nr:ion transporter [Acutalibacter sp.]